MTVISQQMTFEILLNPSVKDRDQLRLSAQAGKILDLLERGPVKTSQLAEIGCQYQARLSEVRHALVKLGLMIDQRDGQGGENEYTIVELDRSTFWQRVKEKDEEWKWTDVSSAPIESD